MERGNLFHSLNILKLGPAPEQFITLLSNLRVGSARCPTHSQSLKQRFITEATLEAGTGILNKTVENDQSPDLSVDVSVLELLPDCASGFGWTRGLEHNYFHKFGDAAHILLLVHFAREALDRDRHGREWFLLGSNVGRFISPLFVLQVAFVVGYVGG